MKGRGHRDIILRHIACVLQRRNVETQFLVGIVRGGISVLRRQSERPSSRSGVVFLSALETNDSYFYEILRRGRGLAGHATYFANERENQVDSRVIRSER